jgi:hypothetical protein
MCDDDDAPLQIYNSSRRLSRQPLTTPKKPTVGGGDSAGELATVLAFRLISLAFRPAEHQSEHRTVTALSLARDSIAPYLEANHIVTAMERH